MIRKLITIKNVGTFRSLDLDRSRWDGTFPDVTIIYAQNGSGKTTLSTLFNSIKGNDALLQKKKTFGSDENIEVKLLADDNKNIVYSNNKWNRHLDNIKVFNSHYIENNVYLIDMNTISTQPPNIQLIEGEGNKSLTDKIFELSQELSKGKSFRTESRKKLANSLNLAKRERESLSKKVEESLEKAKSISAEKKILKSKYKRLSDSFVEKYLEKINSYLQILNPDLQITGFKQKQSKMLYGLSLSSYSIRSESDNNRDASFSLKFTLSEGDKNALALSFFLASIELSPNIDKLFVVIDDPVTSFDYGRKSSTVELLNKIQSKVKRLVVLTHDLHFANDLKNQIHGQSLNLKIYFNGVTSKIVPHEIETESLTGIFKDLNRLHEFIKNGAERNSELREIVRCLRPVLEGIFRIKYYGLINTTEWLGDFITKIREATANSPFYYENQNLLIELVAINNYSKGFHHSKPNYIETPINPKELRTYVLRTIELLRKI